MSQPYPPPSGVPPIPPPSAAAARSSSFTWGKFFLGVLAVPLVGGIATLVGAGFGALSSAADQSVIGSLGGMLVTGLLGAALVAAIVALFLPKWRPYGAGFLACLALLAILAGAACVVLLAGLSSSGL